MSRDQQMILQLVAQGRITPGDAERLLLAWSAEQENRWLFLGGACLAMAAALHSLFASLLTVAGPALQITYQVLGGLR